MSDSKRSDKETCPRSLALRASELRLPVKVLLETPHVPAEKRPQFDPNATIIDTTSRFVPDGKLVDADATIIDFQGEKGDASATIPK